MSFQVDLVWLGPQLSPEWPMGRTFRSGYSSAEIAGIVAKHAPDSTADAWLFWDFSLGAPPRAVVERALSSRCDAWHAGLLLGMGGLPGLIDYVQPTWVFNCDPDPTREATSWRLSLRACLVRRNVLLRFGGPAAEYDSLVAAGLDMGHRYLSRGVLIRHFPELLPARRAEPQAGVPRQDEWRFLYRRFGAFWCLWAAARALLSREISARACIALAGVLKSGNRAPEPTPVPRLALASPCPPYPRVTAIIPTVDRYPYLRKVLDLLTRQTVPPVETIVVDQTPAGAREHIDESEFGGIGLKVMHLDAAGQCTSRNTAIEAAAGQYLLFLDDDVEPRPDLIERHLATVSELGADVSCGPYQELGAGPLAESFTFERASDIFPAGNMLVHVSALARAGLFDLAYDRGQRADCDLGMRLILSGALAVLNPNTWVLHHHAPRGGLRVHKARVVTYAHSRARIFRRVVPSASEIYLARRYFSPRQVREMLWLAAAGTMRVRAAAWKAALKVVIGSLALPGTILTIRRNSDTAHRLMQRYPEIPQLAEAKNLLAGAGCD